jgi:hypothetical protein
VTSNGSTFTRVEEILGGGVVLSKSYMFDGKEWTELAPMSSPRASPACTLVDMDDGEVPLLPFSLKVLVTSVACVINL